MKIVGVEAVPLAIPFRYGAEGWKLGPGALATLHLIAALTDDARFEYFDLSADAGLYGSALDPRGGELAVPRAPGLGAEPDPDVMRRYRAD